MVGNVVLKNDLTIITFLKTTFALELNFPTLVKLYQQTRLPCTVRVSNICTS